MPRGCATAVAGNKRPHTLALPARTVGDTPGRQRHTDRHRFNRVVRFAGCWRHTGEPRVERMVNSRVGTPTRARPTSASAGSGPSEAEAAARLSLPVPPAAAADRASASHTTGIGRPDPPQRADRA